MISEYSRKIIFDGTTPKSAPAVKAAPPAVKAQRVLQDVTDDLNAEAEAQTLGGTSPPTGTVPLASPVPGQI